MRRRALVWLTAAGLAHALLAGAAAAQQIQLDDPVRAAGLVLFPALGEGDRYYYVPQRARLAVGSGGLPEFSFLRYVENVRSQTEETREGEGGGILHAVVQLGATDAELDAAKRELARLRPGAQLAGPAVFRSGKFGLISSFTDDSGELTRQVVGVGSAPILDGGRAAVSMRLTRLGAKILWQSFQTATPDVSFQFEMELAGYRAPMRAVLEADFERIYSHRDFAVAVAPPTTAAEIRDVYDELRNDGAIELDVVGDNEKLQTMIDFAYRKILDIMFEPVGGTGTPSPAQLAAGGGSLLDKVTKRLADARKEARDYNRELRAEKRSLRAEAHKQAVESAKQAAELAKAVADASRGSGGADPALLEILRAEADYLRVSSLGARQYAAGVPEVAAPAADAPGVDELPDQVEVPEFAAMAVYEMRSSRRSDKYRIDLNQSLPDRLPITFSENIGDLRRHLQNPAVFRSVNLDDPLFNQREVYAYFEGTDAADFARYVGFVAVQMRKQHQNGDETHDEARIDRKSFSEGANNFKLLYGYKGDDDRSKWLEYEYRTLWSFQDGRSLELPWTRASFGSFPVVPPYQKRTVTFEVFDPDQLVAQGVRGVQVQVTYEFGGEQRQARATLRPGKGPAAAELEFILPRGQDEYAYEIQWLLKGNETVSSGVKRSDSTVLFIDELPGA